MSDIIHLLPDTVANQIAAGEVIQRPASVIKELMENAVDAGARKIDVWITDAGKTCIQVIDDGKGMSETDARLSFERHATSKIKEASDLFNLHTMGFRGEALASIAAVAQIELKTRTEEDEVGVCLLLNGPVIEEQKPVACQVGANFAVKNLFFNVPARRRFLKSNTTETNNIMNEFERVALVHPEIAFTFHRDDTQTLDLRQSSFRKRIVGLFGTNLDKQLLPVEVETSMVKIDGFVGTPESARSKGVKQFFFVNGRYMRHTYFNRAVLTAFERLIPSDKQVPYFFRLEVEPSQIDVNIHPTKTEIKFENEQAIWQIILAVTKEALGRFNAVPAIDFNAGENPEIPAFNPSVDVNEPRLHVDSHYDPFRSAPSDDSSHYSGRNWEELYNSLRKTSDSSLGIAGNTSENETIPVTDPNIYGEANDAADNKWTKDTASCYQYKGRYIVTSVKSGLMFIDQCRAHIRILYDQYMLQLTNRDGVSQGLLFPAVFQIPVSQMIAMNRLIENISSIGFDIADVGGGSFAIHGVPSGTEDLNVVDIVLGLLDSYLRKSDVSSEDIFYQIALTMAKKNAITGGQILSDEQMNKLIDDLFSCETPNFTPDGKLILAILAHEKVENLFK